MNYFDMISIQLPIHDLKERQLWIFRTKKQIFGTPKVILGKNHRNQQQVLVENLFKISIAQLKLLNSNCQAFNHAKNIILSCLQLSKKYKYFIINENMVFSNRKNEIFVWINPNIFENKVKIYVPFTPQGLKSMIKSIVCYLRLWLKFDYKVLETASDFTELIDKLKIQQRLKVNSSSPNKSNYKYNSRQREGRRRSEIVCYNQQQQNNYNKFSSKSHVMVNQKTFTHKSKKNNVNFQSHLNLSLKNRRQPYNYLKKLQTKQINQQKKRITLVSQHSIQQQEDKDFITKNNQNFLLKIPLQKDQNKDYSPYRTTATERNEIVQMIKKFDIVQNQQVKNQIIISEEKYKQTLGLQNKNIRQSYDQIDQAFKDMFFSSMSMKLDQSINIDIEQLQLNLQQLLNS